MGELLFSLTLNAVALYRRVDNDQAIGEELTVDHLSSSPSRRARERDQQQPQDRLTAAHAGLPNMQNVWRPAPMVEPKERGSVVRSAFKCELSWSAGAERKGGRLQASPVVKLIGVVRPRSPAAKTREEMIRKQHIA